MKKINVVVKEPMKEPEVIEVISHFKTFQEIVGGSLEVISFNKRLRERGIVCFGNDEAKIEHLAPNFWLFNKQDVLCGPAVFVKTDENGDDITLSPSDILLILQVLSENKMSVLDLLIMAIALKDF